MMDEIDMIEEKTDNLKTLMEYLCFEKAKGIDISIYAKTFGDTIGIAIECRSNEKYGETIYAKGLIVSMEAIESYPESFNVTLQMAVKAVKRKLKEVGATFNE